MEYFLYQDRDRERYHDDPVSWAETELKQRQQLEKNREEYDNINSLLGENAPSSIDEYQKVRYNKTEEYIQLKTNVRDVEWMKKVRKNTIDINGSKVPK